MQVRITVGDKSFAGEIDDNETGRAIAAALPIVGKANVWGDEIYFEIPVTLSEETGARADVEVGTLAYWPPGNALCIFYGRTPVSTGDTPRAYSPVNKFGRILGDATELRGTRNGTSVRVEAV